MAGAVFQVDVVGADGGRADEAHAAAVEQVGIAAGAGAHDERIGLLDGLAGDVARLQILDRGPRLNQPLDVRYVAVNNNSHLIIILAAARAAQQPMNTSMNT